MIGALVISHGSRRAAWVRLVDDAVRQAGAVSPFPVESAYLELVPGRLIQDGIDRLESQGVTELIVVPLFVSSGSTHLEEIAWALGVRPVCRFETELTPLRVSARVHLCLPIDADEDMVEILYENVLPLSQHPPEELVLVVGHGSSLPGFRDVWRRMLCETAALLRARGGFAAADGVMLLPDEAGEKLKYWRERRPELAAIAVPLFVGEGYFTEQVIPARLGGYDVRYNGRSLLPHPLLPRWMTRRIEAKAKELGMDDQAGETHL